MSLFNRLKKLLVKERSEITRNLPTLEQVIQRQISNIASGESEVKFEDIPAATACVSYIANKISQMNMQLVYYEGNIRRFALAGGENTEFMSLGRVSITPSPQAPYSVFWSSIISDMLRWGVAYALITRRSGGVQLNLIPNDCIRCLDNGEGNYTYTSTRTDANTRDFTERRFNSRNILRLPFRNIDGCNLFNKHKDLWIQGKLMRQWRVFHLKRFAGLNAIVSADFSDNEKIRNITSQEMLEAYCNAVPYTIDGDATITQIQSKIADNTLINEIREIDYKICMLYNIDPILLGLRENASAIGGNTADINRAFVETTLEPIIRTIEQELESKLIAPLKVEGSVNPVFEFNREALLRMSRAQRAAVSQQELNWRTINEIRNDYGYEALPDEVGNYLLSMPFPETPQD